MDATQVKLIETNIQTTLNTAATITSLVAPQYAAAILIGQAVGDMIPGLVDDVKLMLQSDAPTPEQVNSLAKKLAALQNPGQL
jgi:hypothetical protein